VLIGRSASNSLAPAPQVVTIGGAGGAPSTGGGEETFASDWPASKRGWTIELQTLPSSATVAAVRSAKAAAEAKGAKSVGALNAAQFPSVGGEGYVVYSGEYAGKSAATKALRAVKRSFPSARVVEVSSTASSGASKAGASGGAAGIAGGSGVKPPPTEQQFKHPAKLPGNTGSSHGKKAVEESAKLPDVVETP
jgi:hypothetical protein